MKNLDRSDIIAVIAIIVSFVSLGLGIYEAKIMKQEAEIMLSQQKAAVWPYISKNNAFSYGDKTNILFSITNKGVGPALISEVIIKKDGEPVSTNYNDIMDLFAPVFAGLDQSSEQKSPVSIATSFKTNQVLSPGETIELMRIECGRFPEDQKILSQFFLSIKMSICYASIYGESWLLDNGIDGPKPIKSCGAQK